MKEPEVLTLDSIAEVISRDPKCPMVSRILSLTVAALFVVFTPA
jgi:hypothetical protein